MSARFRAMNTDVTVLAPTLSADAERRLALRVAEVFEMSERLFSRFRPDSELSRLNRLGRLSPASTSFLAALARAERFVRLSRGRFNPTVGRALVAAGYDRSFEPDGRAWRSHRDPGGPALPFEAISIDHERRSVTLPPGVSLDFGGFIKGWAVDRAACLLPPIAAIDAGGDALLRGDGPDARGWIVDVEDPSDPDREVLTVRVRDRAVATSAPNRRRWRTSAGEMHHLIDPRTARPSDSDLAQVTVLGDTVERADVLAKTAFLLGRREGCRFLRRQAGIAAILLWRDGQVDVIGRVEEDRVA